MIKKIGYAFTGLFLILLAFTFYMSPSLVGLLPGGKDLPDKAILNISFSTEPEQDIVISYDSNTEDANLVKLRRTFRLDTLISSGLSDYENIMNVQSWVHSRWKHDGANAPKIQDALYILQQAEKGERFRCVEYATVTTACLESLGYIVRSLGLMTRDVNEVNRGAGHVANEVYLKDLNKWFFMDPQWDILAMKNNIPLNAVELQQAIVNDEAIEFINPSKQITDQQYKKWIGPYLFYFTVSLNRGSISVLDRIIGTDKQLTLVPVDHDPPTFFQRLFRINNSINTNSIRDFYPTIN